MERFYSNLYGKYGKMKEGIGIFVDRKNYLFFESIKVDYPNNFHQYFDKSRLNKSSNLEIDLDLLIFLPPSKLKDLFTISSRPEQQGLYMQRTLRLEREKLKFPPWFSRLEHSDHDSGWGSLRFWQRYYTLCILPCRSVVLHARRGMGGGFLGRGNLVWSPRTLDSEVSMNL